MICIECSYPVKSLVIKYSNSNISLARCPNCGQPCDVYVEYDKVLLTIDLLLAKPAAFKHLIYNSLIDTTDLEGALRNGLRQWRSIIRLALLVLLFKVYLNWAYEEKKESSEYLFILQRERMSYQYIFFVVQTLIYDSIYHTTVQVGLRWLGIVKYNYELIKCNDNNGHLTRRFANHLRKVFFKNPENYHYHPITVIISLIILLSSITRLLPVLIIIWPYDTATLVLIMFLIEITNNYFVFTLLRSCIGGSPVSLVGLLAIANAFSYLASDKGLVWVVKKFCV